MASFLNGLSALGAGISDFAGRAGLEQQRADAATALQQSAGVIAATAADKLAGTNRDAAATLAGTQSNLVNQKAGLEQQAAILADSLTGKRESAGRAQAAGIAQDAQGRAQAFQSVEAQKARDADPESIKILRILGQLPPAGSSASAPDQGVSGATIPSGSGAAPDAPTANPAVSALLDKTLGRPPAGSEGAIRMAIAGDVNSDPAFKYKTAGQKAAEIEARVAVAGGKMTDPASRESMATGIASYQLSPLTNFALTKPGGPETMARALQLNPDYQESRYPEVNKGMSAFGSGKQGDIVRSINVGVQHLDVIDQAGAALGNTDVRAVNSLKNAFQQQFGASAPTTFDGLKQIVGTEIEKAVAGGIGSASDRDRLMKALDGANSPAQLKSITDGFRGLMIGQLSGLKTQYEDATGFKSGPFAFEGKLVPATVRGLGLRSDGPPTPAAPDWKGAADGTRFQQGGVTYIKQGDDPSQWKAAP